MMSHQCKYLQLISLIISFQIMLCVNRLLLKNYQQPQVQRNSFILKWIAGTTFLKCYGCREKIQNPPKLALDDFVMAYKDISQFRDPVTGVLRYSDAAQNDHFHLKSVCVRTRYPSLLAPMNSYQLFLKLLSRSGFFFVCYLSTTIITLVLSSLSFEMCLMSLNYSKQLICQISLSNGFS